MTAKNQDFVVKNGLQVTSNLVVGTYTGNPSVAQSANGAIISGNVGIGTSAIAQGTKLVVANGNIQSSTLGFGYVFPDGTFQTTAAANTPSYGAQGTVQFAGAGNTFSGNTAALFWNDTSQQLTVNGNVITNNLLGVSGLNLGAQGGGSFVTITNNGNISAFNPDGTFQPAGAIIGSSYGSNQIDVTQYTMQIKSLLYGIQITTSPDQGITNYVWNYNNNGQLDAPVGIGAAGNISTAQSVYANRIVSNTTISASALAVSGNVTAGNLVGNTATVSGNSTFGGNVVITSNTAATSQGTGALQVQGGASISGNLFLAGNFTVSGNLNIANVGGIQDLVVNSLTANTFIQSAGIISGSAINSNTSITAINYVNANQFIANTNIGIGTATVQYPLDVYGNIHIGNTATISGILFPDGTFQDTAAVTTVATPSYGAQGTVQFAGASNTFSGNTASLFWDDTNYSLYANAITTSAFNSTGNVQVNKLISNLSVGIGTTTAVGIANAFAVYGSENLYGNLVLQTTAGSTTSGIYFADGSYLITAGGGGSYSNANVTSYLSGPVQIGNLTVNNTTVSTNTTTGALLVGGGVGIGGNLNVGGAQSLFTNQVGIGTSTAPVSGNRLSVYGNIVISNTASGGSGVYFPDGSFQTTAVTPTNSYGTAGTIQFAGSANTFSGNSSALFWDSSNNWLGIGTNLPTQPLTLLGNLLAYGNTHVMFGRLAIGTSNIKVGDNLTVVGGNINVASHGTGIFFPDGSFQQSSAGSSAAGTDKNVQFNDGGFFAGQNNFIFDKTNLRLGIGTASLTNSLMVYSATPAIFNTTNGGDQQIIVGNTTSDGTVIGFNSATTIAYGYMKSAGGVTNIVVTKTGTGIGGITVPQNTLDVGGRTAIGFAYAGVYAAPTDSLIVSAKVGIGTYLPYSALDVMTNASIRSNISVANTAYLNVLVANTSIQSIGTLISDSIYSNSFVQAAGTVTAANFVSNGDVKTSTLNASSAATVGSLNSNAQIQAVGAVTAAYINSNGNVQAAGTVTVNDLVSNNNIYSATLNTSGLAQLNSLISNTNITTATLNSTGAAQVNSFIANTTIQGIGTATVDAVVSNNNVYGATLNTSGLAQLNSLISNNNITTATLNTTGAAVAGSLTSNTTIQSAGAATVNALISNNNVFGATVQSSGQALVNSLISNNNITTSTLNSTGAAQVSSLTSNTTIQSAGTVIVNALISNTNVFGATLQSSGQALVNSAVSNNNITTATLNSTGAAQVSSFIANTTIQSIGTATVNALIGNNNVFGATLQSSGQALVNSLVGNNNVFGATLQSSGQALVNSLVSNTTISTLSMTLLGTLTAGNVYSNGFTQTAGLTTTNQLISNANIYGANLNIAGLSQLNSLISNTTIQSIGTATVNALISNNNITGATLNTSGLAQLNSLISNTTAQVGGTATVNALNSNNNIFGATLNTSGLAQFNSIISNNNITGATLNITGAAQVSSLISNTNTTTATLNSTGAAVVNSLNSNTTIQAAGAATVNSLLANANITGANLNISGTAWQGNVYSNGFTQTTGLATVNQLISNANIYGANLNIAGLGYINSLNVNTSTSTSSLNVGAGGAVVGSLSSNTTIQSAGAATVNSLLANANITGANLNIAGTAWHGNVYSNGFTQTTGLAIVNQLISNANIYGANLNIAGLAQVNSLNVNTATSTASLNVGAGGAVVGSLVSNTTIQSAGLATVNQLISNANIYGANLNIAGTAWHGNVYSNGFTQTTGLATVNQLISNANIYGANLNIAGLGYINSLNVNTATSTASLNVGAGGAIVGNLISNGYITTATLNVTGNAQVNDITVNTVVRTSTITSTGAAIFASINSNGIIQSAGTTTVNALISNTNIFGATLNTSGAVVVGSLTSNTTIQSNGAAVFNNFTANTRSFVTSGGMSITGDSLITGNLQITGNLVFGGNSFVINTQSLTIVDPVIELGIGTGGTALTVDDGLDRGVLMDYFHNPAYNGETAGFNHAFMGYNNSTGQLIYVTNVSPGNINVNNDIADIPGIIYGGAVFGNIWLSNAQSISTNTTSGGVIAVGGIGAGGNINIGGQRNNFSGNINIFGSNTATSSTTGALTVAGGVGIVGNLFVGGNLTSNNGAQFSYVIASNAITAASLFSNGAVQSVGTVTAAAINSNGVMVGSSIYSNGFIQGGTLTVASVNSNGSIVGSSLTSNGTVVGATTATFNAIYSNTFVQAAGTITAALVNSNGTIVGANVYSNGFVQAAGTITAGNVNSNGAIVGSSLTSNGTVVGATIATFNAIYSNTFIQGGAFTAASLNSNGTIVGSNVYSNGFVQAAGTVTAALVNSNGTIVGANVYSNGFVQSAGTVTAALINSNGTIVGANVYSNGVVQSAGTVTAALINSNGAIVGQSLTSNTTIQGFGTAIINAIYSNTFIQAAGTITSNGVISNVYGVFGQNVTINSANTSTSTSTGALIVTSGGVGIGGNINVGGTRNLFTNNVGIGTSTATGLGNVLAVYGTENLYGNLVISNTAAGGSGIYFPDGTFQQTAGTIGGVNQSVQFNDNGAFGGTTTFLFDKVNNRLGIGTASLTNSLMVYSATPAIFNTTNAGDQQIIVGNTTSDGTVIGFNSATAPAYGYMKSAGGVTNIVVTKTGTGIGGITQPQNTLDVGGRTAIGFAYAGVFAAPTDSLIVSGKVGIGTYTPLSTLDVRGVGSFLTALSTGGTATVNDLIANNNVFGATLQSSGQALVNSLVSNGAISGASISLTGEAVVNSLTSNTTIQSAGTATLNAVIGNNNVFGATLQSSGQALVNSAVSNNNITTATFNSTGAAQVNSFIANTTIQGISTATVNTLISNVYGLFGQNVTVNSGNTSTTTGTGALVITTGGAGIAGNINVGGTRSLFTNSVGIGTSTATGVNSNVFAVYGTQMLYGNLDLGNTAAGGAGIYFADGTFQVTAAIPYTNVNVASYLSGPVVVGNLTISNTTASTSTTTGALLMGGGAGIQGSVNIGGNLSVALASQLSFVNASNSIVGSSMTSNGNVQAAGTVTAANIVSNGDVKTSTLNASSTATAGGLNSNAQVQAVGAVTAAYINSNGTIVGNNIYSNGFVQAAGTVTAALVNSNGTIVGANVYSNGFVQAAGTVTAALVNSNGTIVGANIYSNGFVQAAGTATVNAVVSNVYGLFGQNVTVNSTNASTATNNGALTVAGGVGIAGNVISGGNLVHAGASSLSFVIASNSIVGSSITSNSSIQSAGTAIVNALTSNVYGLFGQNVTVNSANASTSTGTGALVITTGGLGIGGAIHAGGQIYTATTLNVAGTAQVNTLISNVYGLFGQNVTVNSANTSTATTNGALTVAGGVGIAGNVISGGNLVVPLASNLSFVIASNSIVGSSMTSNGYVQAGTQVLANAIISNVYGLFGQNVTVNSANTSTTTGTGALVITTGGAGIAGNINIGGTRSLFTNSVGIGTSTPTGVNSNVFAVYGTQMLYGNLVLQNTAGQAGIYFADGTFQVTAAAAPYSNTNVASYLSGPVQVGNLTINNATASTSTVTGALLMFGGAGIQGNVNVGGNLSVALASQLSFVIASNSIVGSSITSNSTIQSSGTNTANALVSNVYGVFGQNVTVNSTNASTSSSTGALVVAGGQGLGGNLRVAAATTSLFGGNLGIGTTSSLGATSNVLSVYGTEMLFGNLRISNTAAGGSGIYFSDGTFMTTAATGSGGGSGTPGGSNTQIQYNNNGNLAGSTGFVFFGNTTSVGIGTSAPAYNLDVWGNIHIGNSTAGGSNGIVFADGSVQTTAANTSIQTFTFTATLGQTTFSVFPYAPGPQGVNYTQVFVNGVYQRTSTYAWTGTNIVLSSGAVQFARVEIRITVAAGTLTNVGSQIAGSNVFNVQTAGITVWNTGFTYTVGYLDLYLNGVKLALGSDYTAGTGTSVTFAASPPVSSIVQMTGWNSNGTQQVQGSNVFNVQTAGITVWNTGFTYTVGFLDVYVNGIKMASGYDYTATTGTSVQFTTAPNINSLVTFEGWLQGSTLGQMATQRKAFYVSSAGQTVFASQGPYVSPYVDVYVNGVKLVYTTDYTAIDGATVVLTNGLTAGANVEVISSMTFAIGDVVRRTGDIFTGNVGIGTTANSNAFVVVGTSQFYGPSYFYGNISTTSNITLGGTLIFADGTKQNTASSFQIQPIDNISSAFDSTTTKFNLKVSGSNINIASPLQVMLSVGGTVLAPFITNPDLLDMPEVTIFDQGYKLSGSMLTFANAPRQQQSFSARILSNTTPSVTSVTYPYKPLSIAMADS